MHRRRPCSMNGRGARQGEGSTVETQSIVTDTAAAPAAAGAMRPLRWLVFYAAVPVFGATIDGANETAAGAQFDGKIVYFLYAISVALPVWICHDLFSRVWSRVLRPWQPSLTVVLLLGCLTGNLMIAPLATLRNPIFADLLLPGGHFYQMLPYRFSDPDYLEYTLISYFQTAVLWVGINWIYWRLLGVSRYGFPAPQISNPMLAPDSARANPVSAEPLSFLHHVPADLGRDILAIEAQEHYVKVYTAKGAALVLYRFGDAARELRALGGIQVHRSFCVVGTAIEAVERQGRALEVHLTGGLKIPVSRSYKVKLEEAGILGAEQNAN